MGFGIIGGGGGSGIEDGDIVGTTPGAVIKDAANDYRVLTHNVSATVGPTTDDDANDGYGVGSLWVDTVGATVYTCVDATVGAAVWQRTLINPMTLANDIIFGGASGAPTALQAQSRRGLYLGLDRSSAISYQNPFFYSKSDLEVEVTSSTEIDVRYRALSVYDDQPALADEFRMLQTAQNTQVTRSIDISSGVGSGGLDAGTEAGSTLYYVYIIYNPTTDTSAGILSTSAVAPTLPSGFTMFRRVGEVYNDSSSDFVPTIRIGDDVYFDRGQAVYTAQSLTTSFVEFSMPPACPSGTSLWFLVTGTALSSATVNVAVIRPDSGTSTRFERVTEQVTSTTTTNQGDLGLFRTYHLPKFPSLGNTSLFVRANATATQNNQEMYCLGYRLEV